jgi:two-component system sensor histidine kinase VicK
MSESVFEQVQVSGSDEIASLGAVFNEMATQIQKDYDEFERVEKSRQEFVANVSHELKTPLTVIKSYSETLENLELDEKTRKDFLSVIGGEADRMSDIVAKLLQLSRLGSPVSMPKQNVELYELCNELALPHSLALQNKNAAVDISGKGSVFTEKEKLKAILSNLISNAVKYCENGSRISVEIDDKKVSVTNKGAEISKDDLPRIFERFYRTDPARSRETGGTGLGLAIAKESAELIGANLSVTSEGGVTTFTLEL